MPEKFLVACDPGKMSGFVVLDITDYEKGVQPKIIEALELEQQTTCRTLHEWAAKDSDDIEFVLEDFIITVATGKKTDTRYSLEIIGAARYFARAYGKKFTLQKPGEAKTFVDNDRLRALDLWVPGGEGHHKDAMRHAVLYLVQNKRWRPEGLLN